MEVPELFFSQRNCLLKVLVKSVNVTEKNLTAAPGFQQICQQRVRVLHPHFFYDDRIDLFDAF